MIARRSALALVLTLWSMSPFLFASDNGPQITMLAPPDRGVLGTRSVQIAARVPVLPDIVWSVSVDGWPLNYRLMPSGVASEAVLHAVTDVEGFSGHKLIIEQANPVAGAFPIRREVKFYIAGKMGPKKAPPSFKSWNFHDAGGKSSESRCTGGLCHAISQNIDKGTATENCRVCHKWPGVLLHGPVTYGACPQCHTRTVGRAIQLIDSMPNLCSNCHAELTNSMKKAKELHGPSASGNCLLCHDPHGDSREMLTRRGRVGTCVYCHDGYEKNTHVVAAFVGLGRHGHPVSGERSKLYPNDEITCGSCHNPHYASHDYQYANMSKSRTDLCRMCHDDKF